MSSETPPTKKPEPIELRPPTEAELAMADHIVTHIMAASQEAVMLGGQEGMLIAGCLQTLMSVLADFNPDTLEAFRVNLKNFIDKRLDPTSQPEPKEGDLVH